MNIYAWRGNSDDYAMVGSKNDSALDAFIFKSFDSRLDRVAEPVQLEVFESEDGNHRLPLSDFPENGSAYPRILSQRAYDALAELLKKYGFFKKADVDGQPFYLYYPTEINHAMDREKSIIIRRPSGYEKLIEPVFKSNTVFTPVFLLPPPFERQAVFVTDEFVDLVRKNKLTGLELRFNLGPEGKIIHI